MMKLILYLVVAIASVLAHNGLTDPSSGAPKLAVAPKFLSDLRLRNIIAQRSDLDCASLFRRDFTAVQDKRQAPDGACGPGVGSCVSTQCCSPAG